MRGAASHCVLARTRRFTLRVAHKCLPLVKFLIQEHALGVLGVLDRLGQRDFNLDRF